MQYFVRLKVTIQIVTFCIGISTEFVQSARPPITDHNREVGSKWTYLQLKYGVTAENLSTTYATIKATTKRPVNNENLMQPVRKIPAGESSCGIAKAKPYVIGGHRADPGEFPWFAAVTKYQYNSNPQWRVVCGASLITAAHALTAAHCLYGRYKETLEVVFNLKDTANIAHTASQGEIRRKIARFIIHPQYNPQTQHEDIALIKFKEPIHLHREKILAPICLPDNPRATYASKNGTFIGYGHTSYGSSSTQPKENSRELMKVYVPILSHSECLKSKVPSKKNITENMICAGAAGKDGCINDSGGPLMVYEKGRAVIVGIASWGIGCALPDYPGIYTLTSKYIPWIKTASSS